MRTRLLSGGTWVCGKTIVPEGLTGPQLSFNFTVRKFKVGGLEMASSKDYLEFVLEQLSELQEITYRAMMGEFIIYYRGKIVGGI